MSNTSFNTQCNTLSSTVTFLLGFRVYCLKFRVYFILYMIYINKNYQKNILKSELENIVNDSDGK